MNILDSSKIKVSNNLNFHFLNIGNYSNEIKTLIDSSIASIWNGVLGSKDIKIIKIQMQRWFQGKDEAKKCGFISEFFCHLYLKQLNFDQHFLFSNLEETNSMKKGFDGLYLNDEDLWLYESKSSLSSTINTNHNSNISEAFNDIKKKINGSKKDSKGNPVDPWTNAMNHAGLIYVNPDKTLMYNLNNFRDRFLIGEFEDIKNFNVIPSSTIYLESRWEKINLNDLKCKLSNLTNRYEYKKMNIICINKKSINDFSSYLNDE